MTFDLRTFIDLVDANRIEEAIAQGHLPESCPCVRPVLNEGDQSFDGFWQIKEGKLALTVKGTEMDAAVREFIEDIHSAKVRIQQSGKIKALFGEGAFDQFIGEQKSKIADAEKGIKDLFPVRLNSFSVGHPVLARILEA